MKVEFTTLTRSASDTMRSAWSQVRRAVAAGDADPNRFRSGARHPRIRRPPRPVSVVDGRDARPGRAARPITDIRAAGRAACHPKGRSVAEDARSALTRRPSRSYARRRPPDKPAGRPGGGSEPRSTTPQASTASGCRRPTPVRGRQPEAVAGGLVSCVRSCFAVAGACDTAARAPFACRYGPIRYRVTLGLLRTDLQFGTLAVTPEAPG